MTSHVGGSAQSSFDTRYGLCESKQAWIIESVQARTKIECHSNEMVLRRTMYSRYLLRKQHNGRKPWKRKVCLEHIKTTHDIIIGIPNSMERYEIRTTLTKAIWAERDEYIKQMSPCRAAGLSVKSSYSADAIFSSFLVKPRLASTYHSSVFWDWRIFYRGKNVPRNLWPPKQHLFQQRHLCWNFCHGICYRMKATANSVMRKSSCWGSRTCNRIQTLCHILHIEWDLL